MTIRVPWGLRSPGEQKKRSKKDTAPAPTDGRESGAAKARGKGGRTKEKLGKQDRGGRPNRMPARESVVGRGLFEGREESPGNTQKGSW